MSNDLATIIVLKAVPPLSGAMFLAEEAGVIGGAGGWAGAGLLGLVVGWLLLYHIPALMKAHNDEREKFSESLDKILKHCGDEADKLRSDHRERRGP